MTIENDLENEFAFAKKLFEKIKTITNMLANSKLRRGAMSLQVYLEEKYPPRNHTGSHP